MVKFVSKKILAGTLLILLLVTAVSYWMFRERPLNLAHQPLKAGDRPQYLGEFTTAREKPLWVTEIDGRLYVSYVEGTKLDVYTLNGDKVKEIRASLFKKEEAALQGMAKSGKRIIVADYANKALAALDETGQVQDGYLQTPDGQNITPVGVAVYGRVFYVTNQNQNGWLAVGDDGGFITEVKGDTEKTRLEFPYGIQVTEDGRVLVTDPQGGKVKVYNCAGWYAYDLPTDQVGIKNPQGLAIDGLGRIHVVDNGTGQIFVFDNEGKYQFAYSERSAKSIANITVEKTRRLIFVTDTDRDKIMVWGY